MSVKKRFVPTVAFLLMYASFIATSQAPSIAVAQAAPQQPTTPTSKQNPLKFTDPIQAKVLEQRLLDI